jgi:hypothetical protein
MLKLFRPNTAASSPIVPQSLVALRRVIALDDIAPDQPAAEIDLAAS